MVTLSLRLDFGPSFTPAVLPLRGGARPLGEAADWELRLAMLAARLKAPVLVADAGLAGAAAPVLLSSLGPAVEERDAVRPCLLDEGVDGEPLMVHALIVASCRCQE